MKVNINHVDILDSDKEVWEAEVKDFQTRFPGRNIEELVSWAVRFYLERVPKMRADMREIWIKDENTEQGE